MNKKIKVFLSTIFFAVLLCAFSVTSFAASGSNVKLSSSKVYVGDTVKVTVSFNADIDVVTSTATIKYDASILKLVSSSDKYSGSNGVLKMAHIGNDQTFEFKTLKAGNCEIKTYDCLVSDGDSEVSVGGDTATLSVIDKTLSSNANLKSLRVSAGTLTPSFSKDVTSYKITIGPNVEQLTVGATTEDSNASVEVLGSKNMKIGENVREVIVTAPSGATKKYTLNITKLSENTTSSQPETEVKLQINVDGEALYVVDTASDVAVKGFERVDYTFKGTVVKALKKDDTILLSLADSNNELKGLYVYDASTDSAHKFEFITSASNMYLLINKPDSVKVPKGFVESQKQINGIDCQVYSSETNNELFLLYAKYGDNDAAFYLYDTKEGTLQRYFGSLSTEKNDLPVNNAPVDDTDDQGFIEKLLESKNNRVILIGAALLIGLIVLILIIVLAVKSSKYQDDDDDDDDNNDSLDFNFDVK